MAKKKDTSGTKGSQGFDLYYSNIFGDRWDALKVSLLKEPSYLSWNPYENEIEVPYYLDGGSVLAALSLPLEGAERVLDMCAAPGGKTLVLASKLPENARMTSNERSNERRGRLHKVVEEYLPEEIKSRITVSGFDASTWCKFEVETYDRIFVDAPCSSERHVLSSPKHLEQWSPFRVKTLGMTQWSILSSAWRVLKPNGYLVYATCALSPVENDQVIEKLRDKFDNVVVENIDILQIQKNERIPILRPEKTKYGYHVLPDVQSGAGPLFFSLLKKREN